MKEIQEAKPNQERLASSITQEIAFLEKKFSDTIAICDEVFDPIQQAPDFKMLGRYQPICQTDESKAEAYSRINELIFQENRISNQAKAWFIALFNYRLISGIVKKRIINFDRLDEMQKEMLRQQMLIRAHKLILDWHPDQGKLSTYLTRHLWLKKDESQALDSHGIGLASQQYTRYIKNYQRAKKLLTQQEMVINDAFHQSLLTVLLILLKDGIVFLETTGQSAESDESKLLALLELKTYLDDSNAVAVSNRIIKTNKSPQQLQHRIKATLIVVKKYLCQYQDNLYLELDC